MLGTGFLKRTARISIALIISTISMAHTLRAGEYQYIEDVEFFGQDNTRIAGNVFIPEAPNEAAQFPAIIFINSWALEEHQYIVQAKQFAEKGYIVLSYSARGWGKSEGMVNVGGPDDMSDFSRAIDWLIANTPVDPNRIGSAGISYGGGMSLLGAAHDPRIKAVASLSGWADLRESLYGGSTPDLIWGLLLVSSGYLTGNMDPIILEKFTNLVMGNDIEKTLEWAGDRSAIQYVDKLNANGTAVYLSNNFRDELFEPNASIELYEQLEGEKKLDLNLGNHATAELGSLVGLRTHVWNNVHAWFDKHLDTADSEKRFAGLDTLVSMAIKFTNQRANFLEWPAKDVNYQTFHLAPRGWFSQGKLKDTPYERSTSNRINSGLGSGASAGTPVVSSLFEQHVNVPIIADISRIKRNLAIVYQSDRLEKDISLRGVAELDLWIKPSREQAQVIAYLYDVDRWDNGRLISHGPMTLHNAERGEPTNINIEFYATSYNIQAGHRVALAVDTHDAQYSPPTLLNYHLDIPYGEYFQSQLHLPVVEK